jgi:hypothetical protein
MKDDTLTEYMYYNIHQPLTQQLTDMQTELHYRK